MAQPLSKVQGARRISLGFFLVLVTGLTILHQKLPGFPSIDGLCPFGGLETLYALVAGGELVKFIQPGTVVLFVGLVVLGVVLSRFFCGWICAFGALQGVFGWLGKKLFRRRFSLPQRIDRLLRYGKYLALALILIITWQAGSLVIRPVDPWAAYGHLSAPWEELWGEFGVGLVILGLSLVLSMVTDRAFCKYVCPLGAVNALLGRIPLLRIRRVESTCTSCSLCSRTCPMNLPVAQVEVMNSPECISCGECVASCPTKKGTLKMVWAKKAVPVALVAVVGLAIYAGSVGIGHLLGVDRFGPLSLKDQAKAGVLTLEDIKGSTTWGEVEAVFGIPAVQLQRAVGLDPATQTPEILLKASGASPETIREAVGVLLGVPSQGTLAEPEPSAVPAFELEGSMSLKDAAEALGRSADDLKVLWGLPEAMPVDRPLRDLKADYGFSMPELKEKALQTH